MWGHDDFADDTSLDGYCHKFKDKVDKNVHFTLDNAQKYWLVDKIASFLEEDDNWSAMTQCWNINGRSDDLRKLLRQALDCSDDIKAKEILSKLIEIAETYGWASRADYMELIGKDPEYEDTKYVWIAHSLRNDAKVVHTAKGYFIEFPEAIEMR
jgi:hypothetical protein